MLALKGEQAIMLPDDLHLAGTTLDEKYLLVKTIGQGGYALVYRAWQATLSRNVAIKMLQSQTNVGHPEHRDFLARFQQEASIAAKLHHRHIIQIFDYGEEKRLGLPYLVMPYLTHGTLQDALNQHGRFSLPKAITYVEQAAEALDYAHRQGIVHRDLKPSNFLLDEQGDLILADFGIARLMQQHQIQQAAFKTRTDMFLGTPLYAAPEMILAKEIDHRVDIYELAIVFFQMVSGEVPFKGENDYAVLNQHVNHPLPQLSHLLPNIPPEVDSVLQKAAAKQPENRFSSAGEFARALRSIVSAPQQPVHYPFVQYQSPAPQPPAAAPQLPPTVLPTPLYHHPARLHLTPPQPVYTQEVAHDEKTKPAHAIAPQKKSSKKSKRGLLAVMLPIVVILLASVFIMSSAFSAKPPARPSETPIPTARPILTATTPTPTADQLQAEATIELFYTDINTQNYENAYLQLQPSSTSTDMVQSGNCSDPYRKFLDGYAQTKHTDITFISISPPNEQKSYTVQFIIHATEYLAAGIRKSTYYAQAIVQQQGSAWQIIPISDYAHHVLGTVTPSANTGTAPSDQPQTIVQMYFDALNAEDYPLAYSVLGQNYSAAHHYCDFVLAHTGSSYTVQNITPATPQADGSSLVTATYSVTPPASAGQGPNTVQENFTVAQEQGVWKIENIIVPAKNIN